MTHHIVYIIGFMGSGKTTTGKKLAALLNWSFIDLDKKIEENTGMTIPEIFSQHGEDYFRTVESDILKSLEAGSDTVISTGGGTPCYADNMDHMLESGLTVYIKLSPEQLKRRLLDSKGERPLIKGLDKEKLLEFIEEKLASRENWYRRAQIIVSGSSLNINSLHDLVKSALSV
jgi:shikimate kinase